MDSHHSLHLFSMLPDSTFWHHSAQTLQILSTGSVSSLLQTEEPSWSWVSPPLSHPASSCSCSLEPSSLRWEIPPRTELFSMELRSCLEWLSLLDRPLCTSRQVCTETQVTLELES